jgi:hypothetical protein
MIRPGQRVEQDVQGKECQAEPNGDAVECGQVLAASAEDNEANDEQHRCDRGVGRVTWQGALPAFPSANVDLYEDLIGT